MTTRVKLEPTQNLSTCKNCGWHIFWDREQNKLLHSMLNVVIGCDKPE